MSKRHFHDTFKIYHYIGTSEKPLHASLKTFLAIIKRLLKFWCFHYHLLIVLFRFCAILALMEMQLMCLNHFYFSNTRSAFHHVFKRMRSIISHTVLTVCFSGRYVREQQKTCVFSQAADQSQYAQQQLWQPPGKASAVKAKVGDRHQVAWRRVQANAAAPDVTLWYTTDGWTDWRQVVWYLAVSVCWVLKVVHQGNEETGNETCQRQ